MARCKFDLQSVAARPWGAAFVREFDLAIAQNVVAEMRSGKTLYNTVLNSRVAEACLPLDGDYAENALGVIEVPPGEEYRRLDMALERLKGTPRGTWAIFRLDGRYEPFMSDGMGGVACASGNIFTKSSPDSFSAASVYPEVLSYAIYSRRNEIEKEILEHSARAAGAEIGATARNVYLQGKTWNKATLAEVRENHFVGGGSAYVVEVTRRGVAARRYILEPSSFVRVFSLPIETPPDYADPGAATRTRTLTEKRQEAAQSAWEEVKEASEDSDISPRNTRGDFKTEGDVWTRAVYRVGQEDSGPSGTFSVSFDPNTDVVLDAELQWNDGPTLRF